MNRIKYIIERILIFLGIIKETIIIEEVSIPSKNMNKNTIYKTKSIMTDYEKKFYYILKELSNEYEIIPIVLKYSDNNSYIVFKKKETEDLFGWKNINGEIVELYK